MNLEEELRRGMELTEIGAPRYLRSDGTIEVDAPVIEPQAPAAAPAAAGVGAMPKASIEGSTMPSPTDPGALAWMGRGLAQGVQDIYHWLVGGADKAVNDTIDDVHLYGAQRLNPVAAGRAPVAPPAIQQVWRELTDGIANNREAQGQMDLALRLINEEGTNLGMLQPGQRFAIRRGESGMLEPIIADDSMTDNAVVAAGRGVSSFMATDPLGGAGGAAVGAAKMAGVIEDGGTTGAGMGMLEKVARPPKGAVTKMADAETKAGFVERMNVEAPIVTEPGEFARIYGQAPHITPEQPSMAVALRTADPGARKFIPEVATTAVGDKPSTASPFAQVGGYFDSLVRMANGGQPRTWANPAHQAQILSEAVSEVKYQLGLGLGISNPSKPTFTRITGWGWYDEDIARSFDAVAKTMPELKTGSNRGVRIPWNGGKDDVTPAAARILVAAVGAPQSFGNPAARNFDIATQAYEIFRKTGQFPEKGVILDEAGQVVSTGKYWTQRNVSESYIGVLNTLIREVGPSKAAEWLVTPHTIAELRDLKKRAVNAAGEAIFKGDSTMGISGKASEMKPGAFIFGPKGGQFMGNLLGFPGTTTDMWFTRTWNRYMGTSREGLGALAETGLVEQPRNLAERQQMADFSRRLTDQINADPDMVQKLGRPMTERDTQAVLWYFEQQLYANIGIRVTPTSFGEGASKYATRAKQQGGTGLQTRPAGK